MPLCARADDNFDVEAFAGCASSVQLLLEALFEREGRRTLVLRTSRMGCF